MRQDIGELDIRTPGQGLHDCTRDVYDWVAGTGIATGLLTLFVRHTSCSLLIQENAAPAARRDHRDEPVDPGRGQLNLCRGKWYCLTMRLRCGQLTLGHGDAVF